MDPPTGSASPTLPSARSLLYRSPDVSADCSRPLPRLNPLPLRSPTPADVSDKTLLVFLHPDRATAASGLQARRSISPRSVTAPQQQEDPAAKTISRKRNSRDFDDHRTSSDDGTGGETPRGRKRSTPGCKGRKPTYLVRKVIVLHSFISYCGGGNVKVMRVAMMLL